MSRSPVTSPRARQRSSTSIAGADGTLAPPASIEAPAALDEKERAVAQWAYQHARPAGLGTQTLPAARDVYLPLVASRGAVGVVGLLPPERAAPTTEQRAMMETFVSQTALPIERALPADEAQSGSARESLLRTEVAYGSSADPRGAPRSASRSGGRGRAGRAGARRAGGAADMSV